ncbi:hypothetical protein IHE44_0008442 [Lamprotornis superbus]|uniref:Uncharacterized protein n=1 Tax=Lamprotornis superbus TaxID=245042 RepID=A0A835NF87_9PASS|nr:hypothetical protein IHE44_0008442 [Lamprotornis superbus]
MKTWIWTITT